ncbi:fungal-specific transcription factor domain-containing protein [Boeremia exigua]|uniref:fungal-specific transcription factor domain-containing protein n=1 Tax=Boeremia exigua TaxID=749465 RepID=UPI001E8CFD1D|nr:fungal-specific transcription factor domain-containing protein [Boeremia exigua]KAH6612631.1 fungal-specific transcription factor domain-containing protein [Boeremia exigua]
MPLASHSTSTSTPTPTPTAPPSSNSRRVPLDKRKRTETSCDKCKSRKQKCRKEPGQDACRYCILHNIECLTTQPRKKRLYGSVEGLGNRLALLESLVKGLLPEADLNDLDELRQLGSSLGIALPGSGEADSHGEQNGGSDKDGDDHMSLLPDQQGQVQYIGPASSFSFHLRLRSLIGAEALRSFVLFGSNPADQEPLDGGDARSDLRSLSTPSATSNVDHSSPAGARALSSAQPSEVPSLECLVGAYFDQINPAFPVLYEASFREAYEGWLLDPGNADPAWLCSFLCVLLLSRRVARITFQEDQEKLWWRRVQQLLPVVMFTSSVMAVQALLLASLHLHNTNHRDACWNLTGTAVRIAFAIGLHQDKVNTLQTPLARELRKRLWWTLYAYEQMQLSSYDRPSAIEHPGSKISCLNERLLGSDLHNPPEYSQWYNRLVVHLGSACRAPKTVRTNSEDESYVGPLSPAAGVLRDMERWRDLLPQHLRLEAVDSTPPAFQRPILMLHGLYHYTVIVLCRSASLTRANILAKEGKDATNIALIAMAESCSDSGRALARVLLKLEAIGRFDAITWWDIWYALASSSALVLDLVCLNKITGTDMSASRILLSQLADLAQRHKRNPHMPGTIDKFASIVPELQSMVNAMNSPRSPVATAPRAEIAQDSNRDASRPLPAAQESIAYPFHQPTINSGAYMFADHAPGRFYPEQQFQGPAYSTARFDRNTQMSFMDFTINNIHDWNWGDLGSLLGSENVPNTQPPTGSLPPS